MKRNYLSIISLLAIVIIAIGCVEQTPIEPKPVPAVTETPTVTQTQIIRETPVMTDTQPSPTNVDVPVNVLDTFFPTGYMGDIGDIIFNSGWINNPHSGPTSVRITYTAGKAPIGENSPSQSREGWVGIYWQYPVNNWGNNSEGLDITGATKLTFWARGETGREKAEFKVGGITGQYPDSIQPAISTGIIILTSQWKQYTIDLTGKNLKHIIGGFVWVTSKDQNPSGATIYLDDIKFE